MTTKTTENKKRRKNEHNDIQSRKLKKKKLSAHTIDSNQFNLKLYKINHNPNITINELKKEKKKVSFN